MKIKEVSYMNATSKVKDREVEDQKVKEKVKDKKITKIHFRKMFFLNPKGGVSL